MTDFNLIPLLPEIFMALMGMGLLMVGAIQGNQSTRVICWAAAGGATITILILLGISWELQNVLSSMFRMDEFAGFMKLLILLGLITSIALSVRYLEQESIERFEFPILMVFAAIGMMMMVSANNMLSLYLALELQSLSLYVLASFQRYSARSAESGIKYFILGSLSSGMLLFGMSLIYGFTGTLDFAVLAGTIANMETIPFGLTFGLVFVLAGLAFKISAVPFHMWTPDVYQGAPTAVTAFFALVPKIAAFAVLMRIIYEPFSGMADQSYQILYFLAVMSMIVGAFAAIAQDNIKRLLAYSSIGNMGYALIGLVVGTPEGAGSVIVYLAIYMVMIAGVFAIVLTMRRQGLSAHKISDLSGLSKHSPWLAYAMAILMFSMSGIPPMAGFFGKLMIFNAAVAAEFYVLATLGVLTSVIAAYYYLKIIKVMFFDEPADAFDNDMPFARRLILFISVVFVLAFILKPNLIVSLAMDAGASLFNS